VVSVVQMIRESAAASIGIVRKACQQIQASPGLQQVLKTVLATGNLLNTGTKQGNAQGFKLASLMKLADSKVPPLVHRKGTPSGSDNGTEVDSGISITYRQSDTL